MISEYMYEDMIHPAVLNENALGNLYELKINEGNLINFWRRHDFLTAMK